AAWHMGRTELLHERAARAIAFGRQSTHPVDLLSALSARATQGMMLRDPDIALEAAAEGLALAQAQGLDVMFDEFALPLAWAKAHTGDAAPHLAVMREVIARYVAEGRHSPANPLLRLAYVLNVIGDHAEAFDTVQRFLTEYPDSVLILPSGFELRGQLRLR